VNVSMNSIMFNKGSAGLALELGVSSRQPLSTYSALSVKVAEMCMRPTASDG
jgi:hypothetical protein